MSRLLWLRLDRQLHRGPHRASDLHRDREGPELLDRLAELEASGLTAKALVNEWITDDWGPPPTDVRIEGVSMVVTRRAEYNSFIQGHGGKVEPLITELEARAKQ